MGSKAAQRRQHRQNASQGVNRVKRHKQPENAGRTIPGININNDNFIETFCGGGAGDIPGGRYLTDILAMNFSGVYSAITLVAGILSCMPVKIVKLDNAKGRVTKREIVDDPRYRIMNVSMDGEVPSMIAREAGQAHIMLTGNAYYEIIRNQRLQAIELHMIHPRRVNLWQDPWSGKKNFDISCVQGMEHFDNKDILHIPALTLDGIGGISPLRLMSQTVNLALSAGEYGNAFFETGGRPRGFLTKDGVIGEKQRKQYQQEWNEMHSGRNNWHSVGILSGGLDWKNIGVTPNEAQFLATRTFQIEEIARWYHIPPHMLALQGKATSGNFEHGMLEFVIFTLLPWIKRWEGEANMKLFTRVEQNSYRLIINMSGLLRGDSKTRAEVCKLMVMNGAMTVNEWRDLEDRGFFEDCGDAPLVMASQVAPLTAVEAGTNLNSPLKQKAGATDPNASDKNPDASGD